MTEHINEPVAKICSKYGDPEAFGERELVALNDDAIQSLPYGTKLYTAPQQAPAKALTDEDICRIYQNTLDQVLREQDRKTVLAFARVLLAAQPAAISNGLDHDFSLHTLEKLRKAMTTMGIATGEGMEGFSINLESHLLTLCRSIDELFDRVRKRQPAASVPDSEKP